MIDTLHVELTVVLGKTLMPMHRALQLARGAVVVLDPSEEDVVEVRANGLAIAHGRIQVREGAITVALTHLVRRIEVTRAAGSTIGAHMRIETPAVALAPRGAPIRLRSL